MKKLLLASVATLAIAAFAAGQAHAADAKNDGLKLGVGGYATVQGATINQDDGAGQPGLDKNNTDLFQYGEINFTAEKAFNNGLTAGYKGVLQIPQATNTVTVRQSYGYFSGNWGRVEAGQNYSPVYYMAVNAPTANEAFDSLDPDFALVNITSSTAPSAAWDTTAAAGGVGIGTAASVNGTSRFFAGQIASAGNYATVGATPFYKTGGLLGDKVAYYTPRFNGFQVGGSYQPSAKRTGDGTKSATTGFVADNTTKQQDERLELAAAYDSKFQGVGVKVGGGFSQAKLAGTQITNNGGTLKDQKGWTGGAQLNYANWTLGGGYVWDNNGQKFSATTSSQAGGVESKSTLNTDGETKTWNAGLGYGVGPYRAAVSYFDTEVDVVRNTGSSATTFAAYKSTDSLKRWVVGGGYAVAPGVDLNTSLQFHKYETDRASSNLTGNNDATVFTVGTTMNF